MIENETKGIGALERVSEFENGESFAISFPIYRVSIVVKIYMYTIRTSR